MTKELREKFEELKRLDTSYFTNNISLVSDTVYDDKREVVIKLAKKENIKEVIDYLDSFTDEGLTHLAEVEHTTPMLSLEKIINDKEKLKDWMKKIKDKYPNATFQIAKKYDGIALSTRYIDGKLLAITRGKGQFGRNITDSVPMLEEYCKDMLEGEEVRGELVIPTKVFADELEKDPELTTARNFISGVVGRKYESDISFKFEFKPYLRYKDNKIVEDNYYDFCTVENVGDKLDEIEKTSDQFIDGAVIRVYEADIREEIGNTRKSYRWAKAFKYKSETTISKIVEVEWSVGKSGAHTPIIIVNPVRLSETSVSRIGLSSLDVLENLKLKIGDDVEITKSGEIIPYIVSNKGGGDKDIEYPVICESCGSTLERVGPKLICHNHRCPIKMARYIEGMSTILKVKGLGAVASAKLIKLIMSGNNEVSDEINSLTDLQSMSLMIFKIITKVPKTVEKALGKANGRKYYDALIEKIDNLTFKEFLMTSGIPHLGDGMSDKIISAGYKSVKDILDDDKLKGFTANEQSMLNNLVEIYAPSNYWIKYKFVDKVSETTTNIDNWEELIGTDVNTLIGKNVVLTGTFKLKRDHISECLSTLGVNIKKAINSKTDYLVTGDNSGGSKLDKAKQFNVEIISAN